MKKKFKLVLKIIIDRIYGSIEPPVIKINQTGPAEYIINPNEKLSFNDWTKYTKVSSKDAERAIGKLVNQDEFYKYQKEHWTEKVVEAEYGEYSLQKFKEYIFGNERFPIQF